MNRKVIKAYGQWARLHVDRMVHVIIENISWLIWKLQLDTNTHNLFIGFQYGTGKTATTSPPLVAEDLVSGQPCCQVAVTSNGNNCTANTSPGIWCYNRSISLHNRTTWSRGGPNTERGVGDRDDKRVGTLVSFLPGGKDGGLEDDREHLGWCDDGSRAGKLSPW